MTALDLLGFRGVLAAGTVALLAWPFVFSTPYDLRVFTLAGIYALLVIGYRFIFGRIGALALTQGAFFGLGAYVTGILGARHGWSFPATFLLSVAAPALLAALIAVPVLRLESHFFALATLGIAQVLLLVCLAAEPLTGGANGISGVPPVQAFGAAVPRGLPILLFVWAFVAVGAWLAWRLSRGLYGLQAQVTRANATAAQALGIDTARLRFTGLVLAAAYAGAAGALFVHTLRVVSPEVFEFNVMVACLAMAVVGGRDRISGAILGAVLLVHLPEWFRFLEAWYLVAYGLLLLAMIVVAPDGLVGALERAWARAFPPDLPEAPPPEKFSVAVSPPATAGPLLRLDAISRSFGGVRALDSVSLDIAPGEILGLIGPNGSGKTTLVNIVSGVTTAESGGIALAGQPLAGAPGHEVARAGIARTFQSTALAADLTLLDNVAVARGLAETSLEKARAQAMYLLGIVGLAEAAMRLADDVPPGLQRRAEIARALALTPRLLLLDEPAAGLSEAEQADLAVRLRELRGQGLTLLIVEHNVPFLVGLADRLVCLDGGCVIAEGKPADVCRDPRVREAYLGRSWNGGRA